MRALRYQCLASYDRYTFHLARTRAIEVNRLFGTAQPSGIDMFAKLKSLLSPASPATDGLAHKKQGEERLRVDQLDKAVAGPGSRRSAARAAEAALRARARLERIDDRELGANDRNDDELREALERLQRVGRAPRFQQLTINCP